MHICHNVTRAIAVPTLDMTQTMSEYEATRAISSAKNLNIPSVSKCWQILVKGQTEIQSTYSIKEATEMILLRVTYAANLPDLKDLIEKSSIIKKKSKLDHTSKTNILHEDDGSSNLDISYNLNTFEIRDKNYELLMGDRYSEFFDGKDVNEVILNMGKFLK